jgi:SAM-dependent methyltransferase
VTLDPRDRFTGLAATYQRHRPSYPPALVDWLFALFAPRVPKIAADVGCGTGIATRLLAARGLDVVGVDPNEDMLAAAREEGGGPRYVRAAAENTGLAAESFDLVACAQAFHWFDRAKAAAEFQRVLRPGGWCAAWWNDRAPGVQNDEYDALLRKHSPDYAAGFSHDDEDSGFRLVPAVAERREAVFENSQRLDREGVIGRAASSSYVHRGVADKPTFFRELDAFFDRHQTGGFLDIRYACRAFAWRR